MPEPIRSLSPHTLRQWLGDGDEIALVDVREQDTYAKGHLLLAASLPLSRLELIAADLLPRRSVRLVVSDGGDGLAERAARRLDSLGYGDVHALAGGVPAWASAGFPVYSGVFVPSKAFAEVIEHDLATPSIDAKSLRARLDRGEPTVILDSRPFLEHREHTTPGAISVPGAELVWRAQDVVPSPDALVVVACAGRTRSIIGAQSLINAGLPNRVVSLRNGTMAWHLNGWEVEKGAHRRAPEAVSGQARQWGIAAAARVAERFGVRTIDRAELRRWQAEAEQRTLYLLDVRTPEEYRTGHLPGSRSAQGGQLVQETDSFLAVWGARVVLVDDGALVRARMTASWLVQMGWDDVAVLGGGLGDDPLDVGPGPRRVLGLQDANRAAVPRVSPADLDRALDEGAAIVVDLALSRKYTAGHIPGAWFGIRARLADRLSALPSVGTLVLTSPDGVLATLAAADLVGRVPYSVHVLENGTDGWRAEGRPLETGFSRATDEPDDLWLMPRQRPDWEAAMRAYLEWEIALLDQIRRDPDSRIRLQADRRVLAAV